MRRHVILFFAIFLIFAGSSAQDLSASESKIHLDHRFGISAKFGGAYGILGGIAIDAFITPYINAELDYLPIPILSSITYFGGGLNIHPFGGKKIPWSPYIGIFYGYASGKAFLSGENEAYYAANLPVGIQYIRENGLSFCLELGISRVRETTEFDPFYRSSFYPTPSMKIGYRF